MSTDKEEPSVWESIVRWFGRAKKEMVHHFVWCLMFCWCEHFIITATPHAFAAPCFKATIKVALTKSYRPVNFAGQTMNISVKGILEIKN